MTTIDPAARMGWTTLAALMLTQTFGWGVNITLLAVIAVPAAADLGISPALAYAGVTSLYLAAAVVGPATGLAVDRFGGALVMVPGTVVGALALALLGLSQGATTWLIAWALQGVTTHMVLSTAVQGMIAQHSNTENMTRTIGIVALATGLCATIMWPISDLLIGTVGWRNTCFIYAGGMLVLVLPVNLWIGRSIPQRHAAQATRSAQPTVSAAGAPRHLERRAFYLLAVSQTLVVAVGTTIMVAQIEIFVQLGTPREEAIYAASLMGGAYLVSRGLQVLVGTRIPPLRMAVPVIAAIVVSILSLLGWSLSGRAMPFWFAALAAIIYAIPAGLLAVLRPTIPQQVFGSAQYGRYVGRLARPTDLANSFVPTLLAGLLHVSTQAALLLMIAFLLIALLAILSLGKLLDTELSRTTATRGAT